MPFASEDAVRRERGRRRFAPALLVPCLATIAGVMSGCTEPQSGILSHDWCHPNAADHQADLMLDDMEDGDSTPCSGVGHWTVDGTGTFTPATVGGPALPILLSSVDDPTTDTAYNAQLAAKTLGTSLRAQYLHGTVPAGGYGRLILPLAAPDLSPYGEIDFWAHSDAPTATIWVAVNTSAATYFYDAVTIHSGWDQFAAALGALKGLDGQAATPADLAASASIEFRFDADTNGDPASFGFWIDDVELKLTAAP